MQYKEQNGSFLSMHHIIISYPSHKSQSLGHGLSVFVCLCFCQHVYLSVSQSVNWSVCPSVPTLAAIFDGNYRLQFQEFQCGCINCYCVFMFFATTIFWVLFLLSSTASFSYFCSASGKALFTQQLLVMYVMFRSVYYHHCIPAHTCLTVQR